MRIQPITPISPVVNYYPPSAIRNVNSLNVSRIPEEGSFYKIKPGDNIKSIAKKAYSDSDMFSIIIEANKLLQGKNLERLPAGITIFIPPKSNSIVKEKQAENVKAQSLEQFDKFEKTEDTQKLVQKGVVPIDSVFVSKEARAAQGKIPMAKTSAKVNDIKTKAVSNQGGIVKVTKLSIDDLNKMTKAKIKDGFHAFGEISSTVVDTTIATSKEVKTAVKQETDNMKTKGKFSSSVVKAAEATGKATVQSAKVAMEIGTYTLKGMKFMAGLTGELLGLDKSNTVKNIKNSVNKHITDPFKQGYVKPKTT